MKLLLATIATCGAVAAQLPVPALSTSVNGSRTAEVPRGWPILVCVRLFHTAATRLAEQPALRIEVPGRDWTAALRLNVREQRGDTSWGLRLASIPEQATLELSSSSTANLTWTMAGEVTETLPLGTYSITAELSVDEGDGWHGRVRSLPAGVQIVEKPNSLTPDQEALRALLRMHVALAENDSARALAEINAHVAAQPKSAAGFRAKSSLLEELGDVARAYVYALAALAAVQEQPEVDTGFRISLIELEERLREKLLRPD